MNATEIIEAIDTAFRNRTLCIHSHQIKSSAISQLRSSIRNMYSAMLESEPNEIAARLRLELLKLQTSPWVPDSDMLRKIGINVEFTEENWGADFHDNCIRLAEAVSFLNDNGSPLEKCFVESVGIQIQQCGIENIRIWCHRKDIEKYIEIDSLSELGVTDSNFICSVPEYRDIQAFEVLYRIGPLRSRGWSNIPKMILSAPRFQKLMQFVWFGSSDESDYGTDPVVSDKDYLKCFHYASQTVDDHSNFEQTVVSAEVGSVDDFGFLTERPLKTQCFNKCVLIEFSEKRGVFLHPKSSQLVFEQSNDVEPFSYKSAREIESSSYLVLYDVVADLGAISPGAGSGSMAFIWKKELTTMYMNHYLGLMAKMKSSGINLVNLDRAASMWKRTDGDVISGPQSRRHFQLLIEKVLTGCLGNNKWELAWKEIKESRARAIQDGHIESSIVNEQLLIALSTRLHSFRDKFSDREAFRLKLNPEKDGLSGVVKFYPVIGVSTDFSVPEDETGKLRNVSDIEIYRMDI